MVSQFMSRNRSMMNDPNYTVLDSDSSSEEDADENSLVKVKQSLAATGNNNISNSLLMLMQQVIRLKPKVEVHCQNTSVLVRKQLA